MIMVIPNKNIVLATDVRDVLNDAGGNVNNKLSSFFTSDANINYWSKRKPLSMTVDHCQDFDPNESNYYYQWWKGEDKNCGLKAFTFGSVTALRYFVNILRRYFALCHGNKSSCHYSYHVI